MESGISSGSSPSDPAQVVSPPQTSIHRTEELNLEQIELIFHYTSETSATLTEIPSQQVLWRNVAVRDALRNPFLMYGIFAIAALHLSYCNSRKSAHYGHRAVEFQAIALREFNAALPKVTADDFGPALLFAGLLAAHVFADPVKASRRDLNSRLEHISDWVKLSQGGRFIVKTFWHQIRESQYAPLIDVGLIGQEEPLETSKLPQEMLDLTSLVESDRDLATVYASTILELQRVYLSYLSHPRLRSRFSAILSWMMLIPDSYHDALEQRRPEALVILAYYAALLHKHRDHWAVRDTGALLIEGISEHLGRRWYQWLAWPIAEAGREEIQD